MIKNKLEELYLKCPVGLQNVILSAYGYYIEGFQHRGGYSRYFEEILNHIKMSRHEVEEYQNRKLIQIVKMAARHVPYYRKVFIEKNIFADDIRTVKDLNKIPLLEKDNIRRNPG